MRMFRFDASAGRTVDRFGSIGATYARITRASGDLQIGCMHVAPNGVIGWHEATVPQLFLVVEGEGEVCGADRTYRAIAAGQAAFWETSEWHETRSSAGLMAIVIEGNALDPTQFPMPEA